MRNITTKPLLIGIGCVCLVLIAIFFAGPRVEIETTLKPVDLPTDLERYVADSEATFGDIIPGAEKIIIWAGETGGRTPLSIVYFHGFSATRQETVPLSDIVAEKLGANLFYTRFTGHGRGGDAMLDGSVNAWLNDAQEALEIGQQLGEKVVVIGVSTGGTAATWLATQMTTEHVAAYILISPNFAPADRKSLLLLWPWGRHIAELVVGPEHSWKPLNAGHEKHWTHRYPTRALLPMMGLVNLTNSLNLGSIDTPVLVIYSPADHVVSTASIEAAFAKIGTSQKQLIPYTKADDPNQHVLAGDILSPNSTEELAAMIVNFVKN